jgi:NADPH:quinone reductase-like Zn-dependent oxidoreductase
LSTEGSISDRRVLAGAVGPAGIQLVKRGGAYVAYVIATVSTAEKAALVKEADRPDSSRTLTTREENGEESGYPSR